MRHRVFKLHLAAFLLAFPALAVEQLPPAGCNACGPLGQPLGFRTLRDSAGEGRIFFGVALTFGRGLNLRILRLPPSPYPDLRAIDRTVTVIAARYTLNSSPLPRTLEVEEPHPVSSPPYPQPPDSFVSAEIASLHAAAF